MGLYFYGNYGNSAPIHAFFLTFLLFSGYIIFDSGFIYAQNYMNTYEHTSNSVQIQLPNSMSEGEWYDFVSQEIIESRTKRLRKVWGNTVTGSSNDPTSFNNDLTVVLLDQNGSPILNKESFTSNNGEISFTFNSPSQEWTNTEIQTLSTFLNRIYPVAKDVYGAPAFNITVNIRKDTSLPVSGLYNLSTNELAIRNSSQLTTLVHEMLHAFRDDYIIHSDAYEEGMVRAAEIEIFNRLDDYEHWAENHSYPYDYFYEALNKKSIGSHGGDFYGNQPLMLLRYHVASYAWGKILIEDSTFLRRFNQAYFTAASSDPKILWDINSLKQILFSTISSVEDSSIETWYAQQNIFNNDPDPGSFLFQRINQYDVVYFNRDSNGHESLKQNIPVRWSVYNYRDEIIGSGESMTGELGWVEIPANIPKSYRGKLKVITEADNLIGLAADTSYRTSFEDDGVFGILSDIPSENISGDIVITLFSNPSLQFTVPIENGAFSIPSLQNYRGKIKLQYNGPDGIVLSRTITKDKSKYFVIIGSNNNLPNDNATAVEDQRLIMSYSLGQNYPNPFNPTTTIRYQIPQAGSVILKVYDMRGREVATLVNGFRTQGEYMAEFNASSLSSGTYIYELRVNNYKAVKKMMLIK